MPQIDVGGEQGVPGNPFDQPKPANGLTAPQQTNMNIDQSQPGMGEQYANSALQYYAQNGMPGYSAEAYQQFQASQPADMSAYYQNAVNQTNNTLNQQMAARGMYGSSAALGQLSNADTNLYAQQAKDQAEYGLRRSQLAGQLGSAADQNQLSWTTGLGNLANQGQQLGMQRGQNIFADQMALSGQLAGIEGNTYDKMFDADQLNLDNTFGALGANATNQTNSAQGAYNDYRNEDAQNQKFWSDLWEKAATSGISLAGL